MAIDLARKNPQDVQAMVAWCSARMESMRGFRVPWWAYWAALAEVYYPQKYKFFVTPNNYSRGTPINQAIVDETGVIAARTLATGLLAGLTSPTKPWFRLGLTGVEQELPEGPVKQWLADSTRKILEVYSASNFYQMLGVAYHQLGVFGSSPLIQYEDPYDVVRFYNPVLGEFFYALDNRLQVDTLYREFTYTVSECVKEFGKDALPESLKKLCQTASGLETEVVIGHAIEPNLPIYEGDRPCPYLVPKSFPYREVFWCAWGGGGGTQQYRYALRAAGFKEKPFVGLRWDVTSNDPYGRSPGMDALPAVRQLQLEQRRKAEAIDKMVRPPMVGSLAMKNEPTSIMPGGITYTADPAANGFKPAFTVEPRIQEMKEDIAEVQSRVRDIFFNPLFHMFSPDMTVQTATWVDAAREEKLILLGPVIERTENEGLDEIIDRTFNILLRRGLLPEPPPEIAGLQLSVRYIGLLAEAQRASATGAIERLLQLAGSLVAVKPDAMDNINVDETILTYGDLNNVPPNIFNSEDTKMAIRQGREQQMAAEASLQVGTAAAQGAKTLSETNITGDSALAALMGAA